MSSMVWSEMINSFFEGRRFFSPGFIPLNLVLKYKNTITVLLQYFSRSGCKRSDWMKRIYLRRINVTVRVEEREREKHADTF